MLRPGPAATVLAVGLVLSGCTAETTPDPAVPVTTLAPSPNAAGVHPGAAAEVAPSDGPAVVPAVDPVAWPAAVSEEALLSGTEAVAVWLVLGSPDDIESWDGTRTRPQPW